MKVLHCGGISSPESVGGISQSVRRLATAQRALGVSVSIFVPTVVDQPANLWIGPEPSEPWVGALRRLLRADPPDILHVHSGFQLIYMVAARWAWRRGIPYVLHPRGVHDPHALRRGRLRKSIYTQLFDRRLYRDAHAVLALTRGDRRDISLATGRPESLIDVIPNPIDTELLKVVPWRFEDASNRLVFLGRFDVEHKGVDRYCSLAAALPDYDVELIGSPTRRRRDLDRVLDAAPDNLKIVGPQSGDQKWSRLRRARAYVHLARWEAFGNSIIEAMAIGVPVILHRGQHLADELEGSIVVLDDVSENSLKRIRSLLEDRDGMERYSCALRDVARSRFDPKNIAESVAGVYRGERKYHLRSGE